jgi:hypothetical protein
MYCTKRRMIWFGLLLALLLGGCDGQFEVLTGEYRTVVAPPAKTIAAQGGRLAGTQAAKLLQTAQIKMATESAELKETAKIEAATAAAGLIDTAQAKLVTQSAGQVTAVPTQAMEFKNTAQALLATQAAQRLPALQTQFASLGGTTQARLATDAVTRFPMSLTQIAAFNATARASGVEATLLGLPLPSGAGEMATAAADRSDQRPPPVITLQPTFPSLAVAPTVIVYLVREGDRLAQIATLFGIPQEKLVFLNQSRLPWLADSPQSLLAGMSLVVSTIPEANAPIIPAGPARWSLQPGCDVSQADWLASPITCTPATIDVVTKIENSIGCISLDNPLGYTFFHETPTGWMLNSLDGVQSYGWFVDKARGAVIVGPALVASSGSYTECRPPE